ncbi:MAG: hypothetical protein JXL84_24840 [Deltaproteobacteria bacterium]|nr:hypothetical protein [Deltaproteobacteria bacterium]
MESIPPFQNVYLDSRSAYSFLELNESEFILRVFLSLREMMGHAFTTTDFIVFSSHNPDELPGSLSSEKRRKRVLIFLSDETGGIPAHLSIHYSAVFKCYLPYDDGLDNIFSFPLGYVKGVPSAEYKPLKVRKYGLFFTGNLNSPRIELYKQLSILKFFPSLLIRRLRRKSITRGILDRAIGLDFSHCFHNSFIRFTSSFKSGMGQVEYAQILADSRIALCPRGFRSSETFRHFEAMRAGCIIVSERLPRTAFYEHSPIVQIDDWKSGLRKASEILRSDALQEEMAIKTREWWEKRCSEESTARFILDKLDKPESLKS